MLGKLTRTLSVLAAFAGFVAAQPTPNPAPNTSAWGSPQEGLRAALKLDGETYRLGEDVRLTVAVENLTATSVYGPTPGSSCVSSASIEVRDRIDGLLVKEHGLGPLRVCTGKALPPTEYRAGAQISEVRSLRDLGRLPGYSGSFTVTAVWTLYRCNSCDWSRVKPFAVVRSRPEPLYINDDGSPRSLPKPSPVVLSPELAAHFEQVDTELGEKTALLDKRTGLKWLHLDLTNGMAYVQVQAEFAPGGRFEQWRYATARELHAFFANFTGTPDGVSKDPSLAAQLQRHMGGPLDSPANASSGWWRTASLGLIEERFDLGHALAGYIAFDSDSGPIIDSKISGSSRDDGAGPHGSYLVRRR